MSRRLPVLMVIGSPFSLAVAGAWWDSARYAGAAGAVAVLGLALLCIAKPSEPTI